MAVYTPPGVFVTDSSDAIYSSSTTSPSSIGIFGEPLGALTYTESILIPADIPGKDEDPDQPQASAPLRFANVSNVVLNRLDNGQALVLGTDYTLETVGSGSEIWTTIVRKVSSVHLIGGAYVTVTYNYAPANFYDTLRFTNALDVSLFYGDPFDSDGNVQSPLSLCAKLAFDNGATSVITKAVQGDTDKDYIDALTELNKAKDIAILTCAAGRGSLASSIAMATTSATSQEMERRAIIGLDGTSNSISAESISSTARQLSNRRVMLVAPSIVEYRLASLNRNVQIGGQYLAAAVAGVAIAIGVQEPLTRKSVFGLESIPDVFDVTTKNALAASGVTIVDETFQGVIRVRHGVTTDASSKNRAEWSVVGVTDYVVSSVRSMLDSAGFIGSAITSATIPSLVGMTTSFLTSAVAENVIGDFDQLSIVQRPTEPDVIDIRFGVGFLFPLNRIYVTMTSSASTGATTSTIS